MGPIEVDGVSIGEGHPTFVVAEAGNNHNGDLDIAKDLVDVAAEAGADAVKFQTARAEREYVRDSGTADYLQDRRSIFEIVESLEMPYEWIGELNNYSKQRGLLFMSTPFDERSVDELESYVPAYKIASYTVPHHQFLEYVASKGKPVIFSSGAQTLDEVGEALSVLRSAGLDDVVVLQCVAAYPTPLTEINLKIIETFREEFDVQSGLSDHTTDPTTAPAAAVALGATVVEKHITLDKSMEGPDHQYALEPDELAQMVTAIRNTDAALGSAEKTVLDVEQELYDIARRRIQAARDISPGEEITEDCVAILRPGKRKNGVDPKHLPQIIGAHAKNPIPKGDGITWQDLART